jgi:hypothetical protein
MKKAILVILVILIELRTAIFFYIKESANNIQKAETIRIVIQLKLHMLL